MQLHDTEKRDSERKVRTVRLLMLYFKYRARGTKFAYETMPFLNCVKTLFSKKAAHQIIHGHAASVLERR